MMCMTSMTASESCACMALADISRRTCIAGATPPPLGSGSVAAAVAIRAPGCSVAVRNVANAAGTESWKCRSPGATRMSESMISCPPCATNASITNQGARCIAEATFGSCAAARRLRSVAACPRSIARWPGGGHHLASACSED